jgi:MFS family permease
MDELGSITWIVRQRFLFLSILGYGYVWMVGTVLLFNINVYGLDKLDLGGAATSGLILLLSIGLGAGCTVAGWVSGERIEAGLVPIGAFGMGGSLLLFGLEPESMTATAVILMFAGFFGGFFLIPLQTLMQELPAADRKGEALGIANIITFLGVVFSSVLYVLAVGTFGMPASRLMVLLGVCTLMTGGLIMYLVPRFLIRFLLFLFHLTEGRHDVSGKELVPGSGGVLLVAEGVPAQAPIFIDYVLDRPVHFIRIGQMDSDSRLMSLILSLMDVTDMKPSDTGSRFMDSPKLKELVSKGNVVCIVTGPRSTYPECSSREAFEDDSNGVLLKVSITELPPDEAAGEGEHEDAGDETFSRVLVQFAE